MGHGEREAVEGLGTDSTVCPDVHKPLILCRRNFEKAFSPTFFFSCPKNKIFFKKRLFFFKGEVNIRSWNDLCGEGSCLPGPGILSLQVAQAGRPTEVLRVALLNLVTEVCAPQTGLPLAPHSLRWPTQPQPIPRSMWHSTSPSLWYCHTP